MQKHWLALAALAGGLQAQSPSGAEFFESRIRPVLAANCVRCHSGGKPAGGLNLSTVEGIARGGDSGPLFSRAQPETSKLLDVISYHGRLKMPPTGKLKDSEIALLTEWVKAGASLPEGVAAVAPAGGVRRKEFSKGQREWWSFRPVKDPRVPAVKNAQWVKNPIDAFILAKLEEKGLTPAPPADKLTLLRRVSYDLTGLPPTPQEIREFLADESPQAFEKVVERLLASPRYGERWGRHWLDVARYADSTGADEDHRYPHAWRYRDYVIEAFNQDLPYDRFIVEQIAGDLLPAPDGGVNRRGIIATGFISLGPRLIAEQDKVKMLYDFIDEQIDVTSRAFLGLTIACARCHDHKFDPILTADYYALAGIFASTKSFKKIEGTVSQMYFAPLVSRAEYEQWERHMDRVALKKAEIQILKEKESNRWAAPHQARIADYMIAAWRACRLGASEAQLAAEMQLDAGMLRKWVEYLQPADEVRPHLNKWFAATQENYEQVAREYAAEFGQSAQAWAERLEKWNKKVAEAAAKGEGPPERPRIREGENRFYVDVRLRAGGPLFIPPKREAEFFTAEGVAELARREKELQALEEAAPPEPDMACAVTEGEPVTQKVFIRGDYANPGEVVPKRLPLILAGESQKPIERGSGRLELARWIASADNPLTARVMVNRIWQWHFGEGLMRTPSNWGLLGDKPSHPELLDWLARRFVDNGWSIKAMHRLILLSNTYQMSSQITKEKAEADPDNRLLSRFSRRRLDVEEIRDAMLAMDGTLDYTMGGTLQKGTGTDGENSEQRKSIDPAVTKRRTVYLPLRRSNLPTLLNLFDFGDATTTSEGRSRTNVAPQALFMMNSAFVDERAGQIAANLAKEYSDPRERLRAAYLLVYNRPPREEEAAAALEYVGKAEQKLKDGWRSLCRILLASNEFIYVD